VAFPANLSFTPDQQEFINAQVGQSRLQGRASARNYALTTLGVKTLEEAQELITQARTQQTQDTQTVQQLRQQIAQHQATHENVVDSLRQQVTAAEHQRDVALRDATTILRLARVQVVAAAMGFQDPEVDPKAYLDLNTLPVDRDTGVVSNVEESLRALAEARPYLLRQPLASAQPGGNTPPPDAVPPATETPPATPDADPPPAQPAAPPPPLLPTTPLPSGGVPPDLDERKERARGQLRSDVKSYF
jgi:hypothetical protein